jgi:4'-phosphopantetheinyl transferase
MLELQSNEVHLWLVEDQRISHKSLLDKYKSLLNAEEQKRLERKIFPKHQKQFIVSRALLRSVLGGYLQQAPEDLVFARNAYGKPRIDSFEKSLPLSFNLSHTNGLTVLAVSLEHELGVDVEYLTRKVDILNLAERYFSQQEYQVLAALDVKEFNQHFFNLWTLKEAYIKACGMGLAIPLKDFSFHFDNRKLRISFDEARADNPELWQFWQFEYQSKFEIALALKLNQKQTKIKVVCQQGRPMDSFCPIDIEILRYSS